MLESPDQDGVLWNPAVENLSRDELQILQLKKLKKQLVYNFDNSEFYKRQFKIAGADPGDIKTLKDFSLIPLMDKTDQRNMQQESLSRFGNPFELLACAPREQITRIVSTSGTTGKPTLYTHTKHDVAIINEMNARKYWRAGLRPRDVMLQAVSLSMFTAGLPVSEGVQLLGAGIVPGGSEGGTQRVLQFLELTRPTAIIATPSFGQYLIEECPKHLGRAADTLGLKMFFCAGEPGGGMPEVRKSLAEGFGSEIFDHTGGGHAFHGISLREPPERYSGMQFVSEDHCLLELIDPETREPMVQADGTIGEMVFTFLDWEGTPFMRYALGDLIQIWDAPPDCPTPGRLFKIIGRVDDMLIVKGVNVYPSAIQDAISKFRPQVTGYFRILLDAPGPLVRPPLRLRVERGTEVNTEELDVISNAITGYLRETLRVTPLIDWVLPGSLPRESKKTELVEICVKE